MIDGQISREYVFHSHAPVGPVSLASKPQPCPRPSQATIAKPNATATDRVQAITFAP
jgi:hypothetical protein